MIEIVSWRCDRLSLIYVVPWVGFEPTLYGF